MAKNPSGISDKSRGKAFKLMLLGGIGLHLFYVGRIRAGLLRFIFGVGTWAILIMSIVDPASLGAEGVPMPLLCILMLIVFNIIDFFKLLFGTFKDNIGNYVRT